MLGKTFTGSLLRKAQTFRSFQSFVNGKIVDHAAGAQLTTEQLRQRVTKPPIVMVSGAHAGVKNTDSENWFTQQYLKTAANPTSNGIHYLPETDLCVRALAATYRKLGHDVVIQKPTRGNIDGHYSTDSDKSIQRAVLDEESGLYILDQTHTLFPNFTHEDRQREVGPKKQLLSTSNDRHFYQMQHPMEFGDTRVIFSPVESNTAGVILAGLAENIRVQETDEIETIGRSTPEGHAEFRQYIKDNISPGIEVVTIGLKQPFYHMDTTGIPTQAGHFFTNKEAYTEESWNDLEYIFGDCLVELPLEDIKDAFGGNGTSFGNEIFVSDKISYRAMSIMQSYGYNVNLTPIEHTIASGGGHRCMTSAHKTFVEGGLDYGIDLSNDGILRRVGIDEKQATFSIKTYKNDKLINIEDVTNYALEHEAEYRSNMQSVRGV